MFIFITCIWAVSHTITSQGYIDTGAIAAAEVPIMAGITFFYCMSDDMSIVYK